MSRFFAFGLFIIAFTSCVGDDDEPRSIKNVHPESIYFDYKIWGEEDNDSLTVMLQYRYGGENGPNLTLEEPCKVALDGEEIKADSSKMTGAFYELIRPMDKFTGLHNIIFTDITKKQYKDSFIFQPFLLKEIPGVIKWKDLVLELDGVNPEDYIRILLTDTSTNDGINRVDTVRNGLITITKEDLSGLVNGPLHLELIKEDERPVKNGTKTGGKLSVFYGLRRDIVLEY